MARKGDDEGFRPHPGDPWHPDFEPGEDQPGELLDEATVEDAVPGDGDAIEGDRQPEEFAEEFVDTGTAPAGKRRRGLFRRKRAVAEAAEEFEPLEEAWDDAGGWEQPAADEVLFDEPEVAADPLADLPDPAPVDPDATPAISAEAAEAALDALATLDDETDDDAWHAFAEGESDEATDALPPPLAPPISADDAAALGLGDDASGAVAPAGDDVGEDELDLEATGVEEVWVDRVAEAAGDIAPVAEGAWDEPIEEVVAGADDVWVDPAAEPVVEAPGEVGEGAWDEPVEEVVGGVEEAWDDAVAEAGEGEWDEGVEGVVAGVEEVWDDATEVIDPPDGYLEVDEPKPKRGLFGRRRRRARRAAAEQAAADQGLLGAVDEPSPFETGAVGAPRWETEETAIPAEAWHDASTTPAYDDAGTEGDQAWDDGVAGSEDLDEWLDETAVAPPSTPPPTAIGDPAAGESGVEDADDPYLADEQISLEDLALGFDDGDTPPEPVTAPAPEVFDHEEPREEDVLPAPMFDLPPAEPFGEPEVGSPDFDEGIYFGAGTMEHRGLAEAIASADTAETELQALSGYMPGLETGVVGFEDVEDLQTDDEEYTEPTKSDLGPRILTGLVLAGLLVGATWAGGELLAGLIGVLVLLGLGEYYTTLRHMGYQPIALFGYLGGVGLLIGTWTNGLIAIPAGIVATAVFVFFFYAFSPHRRDALTNAGLTILGVAWITGTAAFAFPIADSEHFRVLVFGLVVATVAMDVGAYFFGRSWGSSPLAPVLSPNKSIEGLAGGVILSIAAAVAIGYYFEPFDIQAGAALGLVVAVVAPFGDLAESMFKRSLGVKDMGSVLPGHGGSSIGSMPSCSCSRRCGSSMRRRDC